MAIGKGCGLSCLAGLFDFFHDAQQIAAPELHDLFLRIAAAHEFRRDIGGLARMRPALDAAAALEVGGDADMIDADEPHRIADMVGKDGDGARGYFRSSSARPSANFAFVASSAEKTASRLVKPSETASSRRAAFFSSGTG